MIQHSQHPSNFTDFRQRLVGSAKIQNNETPGKVIWRHLSYNSIVLTVKMRTISPLGMDYLLASGSIISLIPSKCAKA